MCELGDILGIVKVMIAVMKYRRVPGSDIRFGEKNNETGSPLFLVDMSWSRLLLRRGCWGLESGSRAIVDESSSP